ncbi:hypothetical protein [uncultured Hoeflea sp.]|uniref:hypothetical protein n=1 Tax=uncultured Hoeflea sp. TaxID=538666 RepID=UPI002627D45F|nr:hypothetical protein [uncultured Hoeflea sp.]
MTPTSSADRIAASALATLIILQTVMLASLYAGVPPHPPAATPLFGIGPLIGASLSAATAALVLGPRSTPAGRWFGLIAAALALVSFGPQKFFDPQFAIIWPAVIGGQIACAVLVWAFCKGLQGRGATA